MPRRKPDTPVPAGHDVPLPAGPETPVYCQARDYAPDHVIPLHRHPDRHQLVYAASGVFVVRAGAGRWVVPSTRAIWMPMGIAHQVSCIGAVQMRSVYLLPEAIADAPATASAVSVTPLLAALLQAASTVQAPYARESRDGRLMQLILDELSTLPALPRRRHVPATSSARCSSRPGSSTRDSPSSTARPTSRRPPDRPTCGSSARTTSP